MLIGPICSLGELSCDHIDRSRDIETSRIKITRARNCAERGIYERPGDLIYYVYDRR